ncbi:MAG TPA: hypothetical protein V6D29_15340 [Leptolyngbyaceae cyanobacterium]
MKATISFLGAPFADVSITHPPSTSPTTETVGKLSVSIKASGIWDELCRKLCSKPVYEGHYLPPIKSGMPMSVGLFMTALRTLGPEWNWEVSEMPSEEPMFHVSEGSVLCM